MDDANLYDEIASVARELYEKNGRVGGRDLDNWLEAEKIVTTRYASMEKNEDEVIKSGAIKYMGDEKRKHKRFAVKRIQIKFPVFKRKDNRYQQRWSGCRSNKEA
jgi:hypothetical protein